MGAGRGRSRRAQAGGALTRSSCPNLPIVSREEGVQQLSAVIGHPTECLARAEIVIQQLEEEDSYRYVGEGSFRVTYKREGVVYKAPRDSRGSILECIVANLNEGIAAQLQWPIPMPQTEVIWHENGIPIIMMEEIATNIPQTKLPDWAKTIDGLQAGRSIATKKIVPYDLSEFFDITVDGKFIHRSPSNKQNIELLHQKKKIWHTSGAIRKALAQL